MGLDLPSMQCLACITVYHSSFKIQGMTIYSTLKKEMREIHTMHCHLFGILVIQRRDKLGRYNYVCLALWPGAWLLLWRLGF